MPAAAARTYVGEGCVRVLHDRHVRTALEVIARAPRVSVCSEHCTPVCRLSEAEPRSRVLVDSIDAVLD
jgi:hypothetical protein